MGVQFSHSYHLQPLNWETGDSEHAKAALVRRGLSNEFPPLANSSCSELFD